MIAVMFPACQGAPASCACRFQPPAPGGQPHPFYGYTRPSASTRGALTPRQDNRATYRWPAGTAGIWRRPEACRRTRRSRRGRTDIRLPTASSTKSLPWWPQTRSPLLPPAVSSQLVSSPDVTLSGLIGLKVDDPHASLMPRAIGLALRRFPPSAGGNERLRSACIIIPGCSQPHNGRRAVPGGHLRSFRELVQGQRVRRWQSCATISLACKAPSALAPVNIMPSLSSKSPASPL